MEKEEKALRTQANLQREDYRRTTIIVQKTTR